MSLFAELRRRNVFRVAVGYVIAAWLVLQVTDVLMGLLELPTWVGRLVVFALLLGFPLALSFSWIFELTPQGIRRESEITQADSVAAHTGRKLDRIIIVLLVVALGYFVLDKFVFTPPVDSASAPALTRYDKSIAVIPFDTRGDEEEGGVFAEGIHDDLLTQLSKIGELHVISRTSVMEYAETTKKIPEIAADLGVKHILEGAVQKVGDRVRINAQLIVADGDRHLWAETYDRELTVDNIFDIQSEIVAKITDSLHATLLPETAASIAKAPTENMDAYRDFQAASANLGPVAHALLESAVEKDPQFALAWVKLADRWQQRHWFSADEYPEALDKSLAAMERAEAIDPDLPQIPLVRAMQHYHLFLNYEEALRELEEAERRLPGNPEVYDIRGLIYRHMGRLDEALAAYRRAYEIDPRNGYVIYEFGTTLTMAGQYEAARDLFAKAVAMHPEWYSMRWMLASIDFTQYGDSQSQLRVMARPDWPNYRYGAALFALKAWQAGDMETALDYAKRIDPEDDREANAWHPQGVRLSRAQAELIKAGILKATGAAEEARKILEASRLRLEQATSQEDAPYIRFAELADVHAMLGNHDRAVELADEAVERFDTPERVYLREGLGVFRAHLLCQVRELSQAEELFRWVLSRANGATLVGLVNAWPPCREVFEGTEHYRRLEEEFGHRSKGRKLD